MVSTRGRYALRVMIDLAQYGNEGYIPMKDVAARQEISLKYLEQILPVLTKNKLVEALHGKGGGYRLTRKPEEYTAGEIIRLAEGDMYTVACLNPETAVCPKLDKCATVSFWKGLDDVINEYMDAAKLSDFIKQKKTITMNII